MHRHHPAALMTALAMVAASGAYPAMGMPAGRRLPVGFVRFAPPTAEGLKHSEFGREFPLSRCRRRLYNRKNIRLANDLTAMRQRMATRGVITR